MTLKSSYTNTRSKKSNTVKRYINEPKFGHIYSVVSLILVDDIMMLVVGFEPNKKRTVF